MKILQVFGVLLLHMALVMPNTPTCHEAERGNCGTGDPVCEDLRTNIKAVHEHLHELQTSCLFFKGRARSGNKFYLSDGARGTFKEAKERCENAGGQVASPLEANDNEAILSIRTHFDASPYLGMTEFKSTRVFRYLSGEEISYTNWDQGEPNNYEGKKEECIEMRDSGRWNDCTCVEKRLIVCEFCFTKC